MAILRSMLKAASWKKALMFAAGRPPSPSATSPPPGSLPSLAEPAAGEPFWRFRAGTAGRGGIAHLGIWATTADSAGHLAVVTETGCGACATESAGQIRAGPAHRYGPSLVLLEDLERGTGRGTGRLIIPARRVP